MKLVDPKVAPKPFIVPPDMSASAECLAREWYRHEGEIGAVLMYWIYLRKCAELEEVRRELAQLKAGGK